MAKSKSVKRRHTANPKRRGGTASRGRGNGSARSSAAGTRSVASDLFGHTADALQTALNLQDEWIRSWADFVDQSAGLVDGQQQWQKSVMASVPAAQRSIRAYVDMMERTSRSGIAWVQTAMDFAAAPGAVWEAGTRAQELARRSIDVLQTGARAVADAHREAVESWTGAMRSGGEVARAAARSVEEVGRLSRATARKAARSSATAARDITRTASAAAEQSARTGGGAAAAARAA